MNEGDRLKRVLVLCLVILMMARCAKEEKTVKSVNVNEYLSHVTANI